MLTENEIKRQISGNELLIEAMMKKPFRLLSPEAHCIMRAETENKALRYVLEGRNYKGDNNAG